MSATLTFQQNRTIEVRLHGELAKRFGKVWHLAVDSPAEAVRALRHQCEGFLQVIRELHRRGIVFRVLTRSHEYGDDDLEMKVGRNKRIDIVPIVRGASAALRFVVGVVLIAVGLYLGVGTPWGQAAFTMGVGLVMGAVTEWLTPVPKKEATENKESWTINGATNPTEQGGPVPIIYGEVITGGTPISAGLSASQVATDGNVGPSCQIGGDLNPTLRNQANGQTVTLKAIYSVGAFNLNEPYTYDWSVGTTSGVVAVRSANTDKATMNLEIDMEAGPFGQPNVGSVEISVDVSGKTADSNGEPKTIVVTAMATVRPSCMSARQ